jgi:hypothetical protein
MFYFSVIQFIPYYLESVFCSDPLPETVASSPEDTGARE